MSYFDCIKTAVDAKEISSENGEWLKRRFEDLRKKHAGKGGMADQAAKDELAKLLKAETAHKRKKAKLAIKAVKRINADLMSHRNARGELDIGEAAVFLIEHNGEAKFQDVEGARKALLALAHGKMAMLLQHFERGKLLGDKMRHNAAQLPNVLREAFGEATGDAKAAELAKIWQNAHEWMRQQYNAAGGAIGKLENWGMPQSHNPDALRKVGLPAWKAAIRPLLDIEKMRHPLTKDAVDPAELDGILDDIWQNVVTEGWHDRQPSTQRFGRGALSNQRAEHRFLIFKDADTWMQYQRDYGEGDIFGSMMGHISGMAKDIAAMQVLGPNPDGMIEWVSQALVKQAKDKQAGKAAHFAGKAINAADRAASIDKKIRVMYDSYRGTLQTPVNTRVAGYFTGFRNVITSSVMGSAMLSSVSDIGTSMITRHFNGIGGSVIKDILTSFSSMSRFEAVSAGAILDSALSVFHAQARYVGTLDTKGWTGFLADRVLAASGLTAWTQATKHANQLAFMHEAANQVGKSFDQLPDAFRGMFDRHGITATEWNTMRSMPLHEMTNGVHILRPTEIDIRADTKLAIKYISMMNRETLFAVPEATLRSKVLLLNENKPGTFWGEVQRSGTMFKSFPAAFAILHGLRIHSLMAQGKHAPAVIYATSLLATSAILGGLSIQLKQIAAGRDPRDMTTDNFWAAAVLQGGGLGIFGDFLFAELNRFGGGITSTLTGPVVGRIDDLRNLVLGNMVQLGSGEKTNASKEAFKFLKSNVPGGNIWYLRLAWERLAMDNLQRVADPEAARAFKRQSQYWAKNFGQDYWWRPGALTPDRGPDLGAAIGQ